MALALLLARGLIFFGWIALGNWFVMLVVGAAQTTGENHPGYWTLFVWTALAQLIVEVANKQTRKD